ncbi:CD225/dispanin family protein [Myroides sp. M-43]|uniref:CD225/dispanin family protein n=1 Tax=Myroides oncorhynchi TaxID=2893756 RepID=UPI001E52FE87|nr:CD225/dispanin family protein [Myroides oncorhynchi]MCC9041395.1 CD225/dispanin family protein [Myroides oncorhynchi]
MEVTHLDEQHRKVIEKPKSNLTLAIVATVVGIYSFLFIGFFLGLIAIGFAKKSSYKISNGDYQGAIVAFNTVKKICYIIFGLVLLAVLYTVYVVMEAGGVGAFLEMVKKESMSGVR